MNKKRLVLIDGHAMLYRAWFAFPQNLTTRTGEMINAVYGFTSILLNVLKELHPEYITASFDIGKTFRHEQYKAYKAHREKMPDELKAQEERTYEVVRTLGIPIHVKEGFEADDVIGTIATKASSDEIEVVIVTGDMDALQLVVDEKVFVYVPGRGFKPPQMFDEQAVMEKYGLTPEQVIDYKGLAGDSSDNIPGVKGIGPKTAIQLLGLYKSIEGIYEHLDEIKPSVAKKLIEQKESAVESKRLATIVRDVPIDFCLDDCMVMTYDKKKAADLFEELEFRSLIRKLPNDEFEESVQESLF